MPNAVGFGPDGSHGLTLSPPAVSLITSAADCGNLALGYLRNICAVCGNAVRGNAVRVYAPSSNGNAVPLRVLGGPATKLNRPNGIYEGN